MDQLLSTQPMEDASSESKHAACQRRPPVAMARGRTPTRRPHARLDRQGTRSFAAPCARASWPDDAPDPLRDEPGRHAGVQGHDRAAARATAAVEHLGHAVVSSSRLTLSTEQLHELTGYKRGAEQARWLRENGFKFRLDRLGEAPG